MSYTAPFVSAAGLTIPSYDDIVVQLEAQFRIIYGQSVYLGNDSADHQWISVVSLMVRDAMQAIQLAYNSRSPATAIGSGLDGVVKINGLARKVPTFSTCQVVVTGDPGAVITNGVVQDTTFNKKWDLPATVTIPGGGSITVTAVCETPGAFSLVAGVVTVIVTPQSGWVSVTNSVPSVAGQPVEPDSALRARQAISTELPSITILAGTVAGIAATSGVTRDNVAENPTSAVDALGNPPHSISAVVEGGTDLDVATAIYNNRGIGCFTNPNPGGAPTAGSVTVPVTDPFTGIVLNVGFSRPDYVPIYVTVNAHLLFGGTLGTLSDMHDALVQYLNNLQIGELVSYSAVMSVCMSVNPDITRPIVTITGLFTGTVVSPAGTTDIAMLFYNVAQSDDAKVIVNSV